MKPPARKKTEFEKLAIGDFIHGVISEVQYDNEHKFRGFEKNPDTIQAAVRIKFALDNYQFPHYSRWMKFSYGSKSNLYTKYLAKLVEGAEPDFDFDLDALRGLRVKTIWVENGDFQNIDSIFPETAKLAKDAPVPLIDPDGEEINEAFDESAEEL